MAVVKDETKVSVDLVTVQETWEIKATVIRATKMSNFSRNIAAKLVEKRCCTFYIPHTTCLSTKKCVDFVSESRTDLYCLQNAAEVWDIFLLQDRLYVGCIYAQHRFSTSFTAMLRDKLDVFVARKYCSLRWLVLYCITFVPVRASCAKYLTSTSASAFSLSRTGLICDLMVLQVKMQWI